MGKFTLLLQIFIVIVAGKVNAQSAEDSVKAVINQLFSSMKAADTALLRPVFTENALLQTVAGAAEGKTIVKNESLAEFYDVIAKQKAGSVDERLEFETIKINGALASVWAPYKFYYEGQFIHCGVNSFQLVKINNAWKIQYIIDTRKKEGCE